MEARVGVSVIIFDQEGKVLVGKRKGSHGEGMLSIPGGHLEFLETFVSACDRELLEEIGVNFNGKYEPVGFSEDIFGNKFGSVAEICETQKHYVTLYFVVNGVNSNVIEIKNMEPDKCDGWEWVDVADLPNNMFCDTYNKIHEYIESVL